MQEESTGDLLNRLKSADSMSSLDEYLESIEGKFNGTFSEYMQQMIDARGISVAELARISKIERTYCYQIMSGKKNPRRDKILLMALAIGMTYEETQRALEISNAGVLYVKSKRDSAIIYGINKKLSVMDVNSILKQIGETEL